MDAAKMQGAIRIVTMLVTFAGGAMIGNDVVSDDVWLGVSTIIVNVAAVGLTYWRTRENDRSAKV
jgi:hypothetical protein